jgi:hypothetical protein
MTNDYKTIRNRLRNQLANLGRQLDWDFSHNLIIWVLPARLACSHRPLRHHPIFGGSQRDLPLEARKAVLEWVDRVKSYGILSIITLMHPKELKHYDALNLEGGLLGTYRDHGFKLRHLPWDDPAHRSQSQLASFSSELERIKQEALLFGVILFGVRS